MAVIHHSDHRSQYTPLSFGKRCETFGIRVSMGTVGDCYDNAMAEGFFASLECGLIDRTTFRSHADARLAVFDYISRAGTIPAVATRRSATSLRSASNDIMS